MSNHKITPKDIIDVLKKMDDSIKQEVVEQVKVLKDEIKLEMALIREDVKALSVQVDQLSQRENTNSLVPPALPTSLLTVPTPRPTWERTIPHPVYTMRKKDVLVKRKCQLSNSTLSKLIVNERSLHPDLGALQEEEIEGLAEDTKNLAKTVADQTKTAHQVLGVPWAKLKRHVKHYAFALIETNASPHVPLGKCKNHWAARLLFQRYWSTRDKKTYTSGERVTGRQ